MLFPAPVVLLAFVVVVLLFLEMGTGEWSETIPLRVVQGAVVDHDVDVLVVALVPFEVIVVVLVRFVRIAVRTRRVRGHCQRGSRA